MHLPTTRENSHVGHILQIKICLDDDALNLASVGVAIHEYLIAKTFVRSERRITLPYLAFVGEASQGAFRSGNLFRLRNRGTTVKVFLFFINFNSVQIIFYLQQNLWSFPLRGGENLAQSRTSWVALPKAAVELKLRHRFDARLVPFMSKSGHATPNLLIQQIGNYPVDGKMKRSAKFIYRCSLSFQIRVRRETRKDVDLGHSAFTWDGEGMMIIQTRALIKTLSVPG